MNELERVNAVRRSGNDPGGNGVGGRRPRAKAKENDQRSRAQLRQPRLAELIAGALRERIMRGDFADGETLPKQEDLLDEFKVSKPSVREALRVLETEGLIQVRRGNQGGAMVRLPQSRDAAYMFGLVLQSKNVGLDDVGLALQHLEPTCAAMCAERSDRADVVATLREVHQSSVDALDEEIEFVHEMRRFHETIVGLCANETMKAVVGSIAALWSAKERAWARVAAETGDYPGPEMRRSGVRAHARILELIEQGDADGVTRVAYGHLCASQIYALSDAPAARIDAAVLRGARFT